MTQVTIRAVDPETQRVAVFSNALYVQLQGATPAQIDAYLTANVTTIAQARPVLSLLLQGLQFLLNKENAPQ